MIKYLVHNILSKVSDQNPGRKQVASCLAIFLKQATEIKTGAQMPVQDLPAGK